MVRGIDLPEYFLSVGKGLAGKDKHGGSMGGLFSDD